MGTGGMTIALMMASQSIPALWSVATSFLIIAIFLFTVFIALFIIRFNFHFPTLKQDIIHPIKSNFLPMIPISLIIIGIAVHKLNVTITKSILLTELTHTIFWVGAIGIFLSGWSIVAMTFINSNITIDHANYGWLIPPVSHLIIPVLGLSLVHPSTPINYSFLLLFVSLIAFGIGAFQYIFVGSIVYHRYTYSKLPASKLAPTFFIGLAPTSIITIILLKIQTVPEMNFLTGALEVLSDILPVFAVMTWGFSLWWIILSTLLLMYHILKRNMHFSMSFWSYIFPSATFSIATGSINNQLNLPYFSILFNLSVGILLGLWFFVLFLTLKHAIFTPNTQSSLPT